MGKYVFDDMTENSLYPSLTKFNYSSNKINNLPRQLSNWWKFFPALRELDLSNDNIESFSFDHPDVNQDFVFISLENNNITSVPADLPTYLNGKTPLVINLLGNPIHCDCKARALSQYLISLQAIAPQFHFLSDVKCNSPSTLEGICVKTLNFDYCQAWVLYWFCAQISNSCTLCFICRIFGIPVVLSLVISSVLFHRLKPNYSLLNMHFP